jgi:hypothetical protein
MAEGHDQRGRFTKGNKQGLGRPVGARNKPRDPEARLRKAGPATVLRFHDLLGGIVNDLGGEGALSTGQQQLARRCAFISTQCEIIERKATEGETVNPLVYGALTGQLVRAFKGLGLERRPPTLALQDYLAAQRLPESDEGHLAPKEDVALDTARQPIDSNENDLVPEAASTDDI